MTRCVKALLLVMALSACASGPKPADWQLEFKGAMQSAVSAYLGAVPVFENRELAKAAASILGDEAMHWAILRNALGEDPVPSAFMS